MTSCTNQNESSTIHIQPNGDVIYVIQKEEPCEDEQYFEDEYFEEDHQQVYHVIEEGEVEGDQIYEVVEADAVTNLIAVDNDGGDSKVICYDNISSSCNDVEPVEILSNVDSQYHHDEQIIYVTTESSTTNETCHEEVSVMQIGGPDVASEETIETSVIVKVPEERVEHNPTSTDHCYTFKRGIKPKDLDKAKTKAAMLGEREQSHTPSQPYTFILPKNPTTQIIFPNTSTFETHKLLEKRQQSTSKQPRCSKHRWLWQFMKELLFVGDPSIQWFSQREGSFILKDQDSLAIKWECYKKLHKMKAQVWRQMRYYFGWMEENKIVRPVTEFPNRYQFQEKFYREKFLPYKFRPHADLEKISTMAAGMDPSLDILSRYRHGAKEKVFCFRGCGSQFINKEACQRHESVCTFVQQPKQPSFVTEISKPQ